MIAALYVQNNGSYYGLPGVDPWNEERDARKYAGPWPVVAHPPCQRWGKMWFGQPLTVSSYGNAAQEAKLIMLKDIRSLVASLSNRRASA